MSDPKRYGKPLLGLLGGLCAAALIAALLILLLPAGDRLSFACGQAQIIVESPATINVTEDDLRALCAHRLGR